jgi:release factor glutamine methyltransferase
VRFLESDWFSNLESETFDVIVSNPPYIAADDPHLAQGDLRFEPLSALASGHDGLDDIRRIIAAAAEHLNQGGWLLLEHGYEQAAAVAELLQQHHFLEIAHCQDLAQITRVSFGQFRY